jgi:hypothetical protein
MNKADSAKPFILQFAEPICPGEGLTFRYNASRQVGEVCIAGKWIDALDAPNSAIACEATKITEIRKETTDDQ